jgi:long-chain fatty acid transport protein
MRHPSRAVLLCLVAVLAGADLASAAGFGLFQHGGRAMGQVGAFTARASEPSAVTYNPAAITRLEGFQFQAGLDFDNAQDNYKSATGRFSAEHVIQFPPALYATWKQKDGPFAFGIGLDAPFYYRIDWSPRLFPGRFVNRLTELRVFELHPVLAYDLGEGWSVGGGVRYAMGSLKQEDNARFAVSNGGLAGPFLPFEVERNASSDVDALAWDLAVHYTAPSWGWGAVYRSPERLKGNGDVSYNLRDVPAGLSPATEAFIRSNFDRSGSARQSFELPREIRAGIWYAPYPELRIELDASLMGWSSLEATDVTYDPDVFRDGPTVPTRTARDWKDTTSLRLGVEGDITDNLLLFGGVASEPSPVPDHTAEPGFPRGDAMVYGLGFSYGFPQLSFDVGYSFHDHDDRGVRGQELDNPSRTGTYKANEKVWGFAVRWRR